MLLITFLIYFQNIFIAQAAVMKITNSPLADYQRSQKYSYEAISENDGFRNKDKIKGQLDTFPETIMSNFEAMSNNDAYKNKDKMQNLADTLPETISNIDDFKNKIQSLVENLTEPISNNDEAISNNGDLKKKCQIQKLMETYPESTLNNDEAISNDDDLKNKDKIQKLVDSLPEIKSNNDKAISNDDDLKNTDKNQRLVDTFPETISNNDEAVSKDDSKNKDIKKRYSESFPAPKCRFPIKAMKPMGRIECDPVPVQQNIFRATRLNGDAYIERKSEKEKMGGGQGGGQPKFPGKRESFSNLTSIGNISNNLSTVNIEANDSCDKVPKLLHPDLDNFYDSELIRKLSDENGKLPTSLKVVIPPDKEPIVVYNESEDDSFNSRNFMKREAVTAKSNLYYDYNDYEEQQSDNSRFNSGPYNIRKKNSNEESKTPNISVTNPNPEISKIIPVQSITVSKVCTNNHMSLGPITIRYEIRPELPKNKSSIFELADSLDDSINIGALRKATCPPPEAPGKKGCHPGGGVPKSPIMPPLIKTPEKDPEYDKLMRGEITERVIKAIVDKVHKNPSMAVELGICDFDLGEMRTMFRKIRNRDKSDCCSRLSGEFKCFLTWLLTMEPSRKKREQEQTQSRFSTCNQFPKFDLMGSECYKKPSPQYEKLVQRVEEYKDENNVK